MNTTTRSLKAQAQDRANLTGEPWIYFRDHAGTPRIEALRSVSPSMAAELVVEGEARTAAGVWMRLVTPRKKNA